MVHLSREKPQRATLTNSVCRGNLWGDLWHLNTGWTRSAARRASATVNGYIQKCKGERNKTWHFTTNEDKCGHCGGPARYRSGEKAEDRVTGRETWPRFAESCAISISDCGVETYLSVSDEQSVQDLINWCNLSFALLKRELHAECTGSSSFWSKGRVVTGAKWGKLSVCVCVCVCVWRGNKLELFLSASQAQQRNEHQKHIVFIDVGVSMLGGSGELRYRSHLIYLEYSDGPWKVEEQKTN